MQKDRLDVKNLEVYCHTRGGKKDIVKDVSFSLESGESLAIVGESGCGKTMTAMSLFQLLPAGCFSGGEALLNGCNLLDCKNIKQLRGTEIVLIPQSGAEFLDPIFKIRYQIFETLRKAGVPKKDWNKTARELLSLAGFASPE
ncbi:MAG: ABC transporter ATP-binding protein, partial [Clostridiales bacterium]|nr:ABC transporter ATP-binding protein [Clostridiales bacterium]